MLFELGMVEKIGHKTKQKAKRLFENKVVAEYPDSTPSR